MSPLAQPPQGQTPGPAAAERTLRERLIGSSRTGWLLRGALVLVLLALLALPLRRVWSPVPQSAAVFLLHSAAPSGEARAVIDAWQAALSEEGFQASLLDADRVGRNGSRLPAERHRNGLFWSRLSPHVYRQAPLHNHVVGEEGGEGDIGPHTG